MSRRRKSAFRVLAIGCMTAMLICLLPNVSEAREKPGREIRIATERIPEIDRDSLLTVAQENVRILSDLNQINYDSNVSCTVMNGYYTYVEDNGEITRGNIEFPVFQNGKCIFLISASLEDDQWLYSCAAGYASCFDRLEGNVGRVVYRDNIPHFVTDDFDIDLIDGRQTDLEPLPIQKEQVAVSLEAVGQVEVGSGLVTASESMSDSHQAVSVAGFSIYQTDYKVLEMANCLCGQYVLENGVLVKHSMCWACASCCLIRYRLGNYNIYPEVICQQMNVGLDQGILWAHKAYDAIAYYGATTGGYEDLTRKANSQTEIRHNLNNRFPIYMGGLATNLTGHAVLMIGYQYVSTSNTFYMIYWDSNDEQIKTSVFGTGAKTFVSGGTTYYWNCSVLIPYNG